ncbi:hypothetical protein DLX05_21625 [Shigella sonnei]|nr:hypothetical protein [Shigella sonnei]
MRRGQGYRLVFQFPIRERDSDADTTKIDVLPRKNRKDASGSFSARCIAMHESEWRSLWELTVFIPSVFNSFLPGKLICHKPG